jgi:hypothetical protein
MRTIQYILYFLLGRPLHNIFFRRRIYNHSLLTGQSRQTTLVQHVHLDLAERLYHELRVLLDLGPGRALLLRH